jgi:hypothetical protein
MFCTKCGKENAPGTATCAHCGAPLAAAMQMGSRPNIPNYLVQAILVTLFCCLPLGIVSIVYAAQVNGKLAAGDVAGATQASQSAKKWAWISFGSGLVVGLIYVVLMVIGAAAGMAGG